MEWIRFGFAALLIMVGLLFMVSTMLGAYRFGYVLNRMHAAAMGDTLGIACCLIGLIILCGFTFTAFKLVLVIVLLWLASPVTSHLISRLEVTTNQELEKDCAIEPDGKGDA